MRPGTRSTNGMGTSVFGRVPRLSRHLVPLASGVGGIGLVLAGFGVTPAGPELRAGAAQAQALPGVVVTGVAPNNSSAKIDFEPIVGAKDYRVYDTANPSDVKYAGLVRMTASAACPGPY